MSKVQMLTQQGCLLIPATIIAAALQAAEVATAANVQLPIGTENTDPIQRTRRQKPCVLEAPSIMDLCCNIMGKSAVLALSMMKQCLRPVTFGSRTLLSMIEIGMTRFRLPTVCLAVACNS